MSIIVAISRVRFLDPSVFVAVCKGCVTVRKAAACRDTFGGGAPDAVFNTDIRPVTDRALIANLGNRLLGDAGQ